MDGCASPPDETELIHEDRGSFGRKLGDGAHRAEARARFLGIAGGCRPRASGGAIKNVLELRAF